MPQVRRTHYWERPRSPEDFSKYIDPDYPDTRTVHVKILNGNFVTVLPPVRFRPIETPKARGIASPNPNPDEGHDSRQLSPVLLICRRLIDAAMHDALEFTREIQAAEDDIGGNACAWIEERIGKPLPTLYESDPEYKAAYQEAWYGSFEWCCYWLGYSEKETEEYRQELLSSIDRAVTSRLNREAETEIMQVSNSLLREISRGVTWWSAAACS